MITPWFKIEQNEQFIIIIIKAKHLKISVDSEPEIHIDNYDFKFYCKPYYLRLHFTNRLAEDGRETAEYDKGFFRIKVPKLIEGENFEDLSMLTKLLTLPGKSSAMAPSIQLIEESESSNQEDKTFNEEDEEEEIDWHIEQTLVEDDEEDDVDIVSDKIKKAFLSNPRYGFANLRQGIFKKLQAHLWNVIDLKNADSVHESERKKERMEDENKYFDDDHYLADLYEVDMIEHIINFKADWTEIKNRDGSININKKDSKKEKKIKCEFTQEDEEDFLKLPRKRYILDKQQKTMAYLGLLDILFAYAYDHRTTEAENNVESGWTICKLSSTLSWLDSFVDMRDVVLACVRRSLVYPLYRNFTLSLTVCNDVVCILKAGREYVLKCLLQTRRLLLDEDDHYLLNQLYIDDYCCWLQSTKDEVLVCMATEMGRIEVKKEDVGFDLVELENASKLVMSQAKSKYVCVLAGDDDSDDGSSEDVSTDDSDDGGSEDENSDGIDVDKDKIESEGINQLNSNKDAKRTINDCIQEMEDLKF